MNYDPNSKFLMWKRNVIDEFKTLSDEEIHRKLDDRSNNFAVLMTHVEGDFNIGTTIRSANFHGARDFFYLGKKKFDKRSCVGVHNYTKVNFLESFEQLVELKSRYCLVALENNVMRSVSLYDFEWPSNRPPCIVIGEECNGIPHDVIEICDFLVEIPNHGSIRSLNAGSAASIAMYDYVNKSKRRKIKS